MKKILTLCLVLSAAFATEADAQWRKTWDFSQGYSEETKANLNADTEHWNSNRKDDNGVTTGWVDVAKMSGELKANGEVIEELRGLSFSSSGLSSSKNYLLDPSTIRMARANNIVYLPKLTGGQTVTIVARSANSSKIDRGFVAGVNSDTLQYISGPADGLCLGKEVSDPEGIRDEDGNYTLVWKVRDDITDSVEIGIKLVGGGCDISLIQIDEGDNPGATTMKIGYILDSTYPGYVAGADGNYIDDILGLFKERMHYERVDIDLATDVSLVTVDSLKGFDVVIVSPFVGTDNQYLQTVKQAVAFTPVLNLNPAVSAAWGYGSVVESSSNLVKVSGRAVSSPLFVPNDPTISTYVNADGTMPFLYEQGYNVVGFSIPEGSYFASDSVLATTMDGTPAIHIHNMSRNAYMLLPYPNPELIAESAYDILPNAIVMLSETKRDDANTGRPLVSEEYHHLYTTVKLTATTAGAAVYYTTDGSTPTTESTLYTGPFDVSEKGVTVKAVSLGDGFLLSEVVEQPISIYELAGKPEISFTEESGKSTVTITPAAEGDVVYYNLSNSNDSVRSSVYTEPLVLTKHATITAFTMEKPELGQLQSESVTMFIPVMDEQVRLDVVAHMDAGKDYSNGESKSYYYTKGYKFYTDNPTGEIKGDTIVFEPANQLTVYNPGTGWEVKTYGQPCLWQGNNIDHNVADFNNYNPETALDDSEEITNYCITFSSVNQVDGNGFDDPASACIQSTTAFQAPFDVVGYLSGHNADVRVLVTTDTLDASSWREIGQLYGGSIEGKADNGKDGKDRIWKKTVVPYNGTDLVFVKIASGGNTANIFDIYIKNEGEQSQAYITGIKDVNQSVEAAGEVVSKQVYSINGARLNAPVKGINIIKQVYANGAVKATKVVIK